MIPATTEFLVDYYRDILSAKTEEEILNLKENMQEVLKSFDYTEEETELFFEEADNMVEEGFIFQELDKFVEYTPPVYDGEIFLEENQELEAVQEVSVNNTEVLTSGTVGVGLITIMTALALKKKYLKNNKQIKR